jgi:hypothetical protein
LAASPTSKSATTSGAAKDDMLGQDGDFIFSIKDLLANDPGGAAKLDLTKQFFFGDTAADRADQAGYLAKHGITDDGDGTYTIKAGATDFNYFVQIGNKGTWSEVHVDVTASVPHAGDTLFFENFDGHAGDPIQSNGVTVAEVVDLNAASGWTGASHTELGANGYGGVAATSGGADGFWFDTQNSPGGVNISHSFTDSTAAVAGKTSVLSFDIGTQDLTFNGQHYATDPNASFDFKIDNQVVAHFDADDFAAPNAMLHFDIDISAYAGAGDTHMLSLVDTTANAGFTGFAVDSIAIHDWIV